MDWLAIAAAIAGVIAVPIGVWQLWVAIAARRDAMRTDGFKSTEAAAAAEGLSVTVPLGRLPAEVRGRAELIAELRQSLSRRQRGRRVWVLAGMGGIGKSTVALAIARMARDQGWRVWWVGAGDTTSLTGGLLEVLHQLDAPLSVTRPVQEGAATAADRAWEFLAQKAGRRWLLVFDNADTPAVLAAGGAASPADGRGWLRPDPSGLVVVTTRVRDLQVWGNGVVLRELHALDDATAAQVLRDCAPGVLDETGQQASELGRRLGGLPLALHLAGAYLASPFASWNSFAGYRDALDSMDLASALAALADPDNPDPRATVLRTWELSLDALAAQDLPQARALLYLLSCYAPAFPIPRTILRPEIMSAVAQNAEVPAGADHDTAAGQGQWLSRGLAGLSRVGLIDSESNAAVTVHPIVADTSRTHLVTTAPSELRGIGADAVRLLEVTAGTLNAGHPADWPAWHILVAHVEALLAWLGAHLEAPTLVTLINLAVHAGEAMVRSANYATAGELARASLATVGQLPGDHPATLASCHLLAQAIEGQGRYREAEQQYGEVLAVERHVLGKDHPDTLGTRHDLAHVIFAQQRWPEAEPLYREVLAARQQVLGENHPDTLATRNDLAWAIAWQGRNSEAEQQYREILDARRRELGENHPDTLATRNDLAWAIAEQGRYREAEQLYREVLADRRRVLGDDHPATLTTHHNLAWVIAQEGRYKDAESLYREVLAARRKVLGDDDRDTLATRHNVAEAILNQGRSCEAEPLLREVLADRLRVLTDSDPATLATRDALARAAGHGATGKAESTTHDAAGGG